MILVGGGVRLEDIIGGTLNVGAVPWARLIRLDASAANAGLVTLVAGNTTIVTVDLGTVVVGDRIYCDGTAQLDKGVTAGISQMFVAQSTGTAVLVSYGGQATSTETFFQQASESLIRQVGAIFRVTTGGTLTMRLAGLSNGSNATVQAGAGGIYGVVFRGPAI